MAEKKATRTRNFATVIYIESAPENWKDILQDLRVQAFISPYHDKDINPTGELKKPHYHIMMMYDSVKTVEQAAENFIKFGGVGCEVINSTRGYARYLCHLDNPEKTQYSVDDVQSICGADYLEIISLVTDKFKIIGEMQDFCDKYNVTSFYLLAKYARQNESNWYRSLCENSTFYIKEYLKSKEWSASNGREIIVDENGIDLISGTKIVTDMENKTIDTETGEIKEKE